MTTKNHPSEIIKVVRDHDHPNGYLAEDADDDIVASKKNI